jgi:cell division transport system permease protein
MMNGLSQHLYVLRATLGRLFGHPVATLLNVLVIGVALSLPAGLYVLIQNVQGIADQVAGTPQISVFLSMNASDDDIARIGKQLRLDPSIDHIEFVSRKTALEQLKRSTGLADVIGGLTQNPLPDAYIVYPKATSAQALEILRDALQKWPKLDKVQLDSAWAHRLEALLQFGRLAALVLTALLSFALIAVTFNTIRLQILTQREEIEVARLIGATRAFIRRPFLYFGLLQGLLGGAMAWAILALSLHLLNSPLAGLAELYDSRFALYSLSSGDSLALLLFSAWLGWIGAWLSVTQHLWRISAQ